MKKILTLLACLILAFTLLPRNNAVSAAVKTDNNVLGGGAKAAYLMQANGGEVMYAHNENQRLTIASMTKIMLLNEVFSAVERGELAYDEEVTVSENAMSMGGSQVFLRAHENYKAEDLIKSVIVSSANDASVCLAERLFGSENAAVDVFNERCREWGLNDTLFSNVTGLPKPTQYSCAKDVAVMLDKLVSHDDYFKFSTVYTDELVHADGKTTMLANTNKLVRFYNGCDGGKTGYTDDAGFCLAATAKRGALRVISVVIGESDSKSRFKDVSESFDYAFANYSAKILYDGDEFLNDEVEVRCGVKDFVKIKTAETVYVLEKKGEKSEYEVSLDLSENVKAPVENGAVVGTMSVYKNGTEYKTVNIVCSEEIEKLNVFSAFRKASLRWRI